MTKKYITREQLMHTAFITRVLSQIDTPGSLFQNFYRMTAGSPGSQRVEGRNLGWDLFHATRSMAVGRPPRTGPANKPRKPYGHVSATAYRSHEKLFIPDEELIRYRPAGGPIGSIDQNGATYIRQQLSYMVQKFRNAREFMVSRMFRGGWGVKIVGEDYQLVELDAGTFNVDVQMPSAHKGVEWKTLTSAADSLPWSDVSADIPGQFRALETRAARVHGAPPRHIWLNGDTANYLFSNTQLQNLAGTAFRVFESMTRREIDPNSKYPDTGYDIVFRGMPLYTFHIYNGGLVNAGTSESFDDQISTSNFTKFLPDDYIIVTPEPGGWCGYIEGSELIRRNVTSQAEMAYGFSSWGTPVIDPPGVEYKALDNGLPALYEPYAIYYAKVADYAA